MMDAGSAAVVYVSANCWSIIKNATCDPVGIPATGAVVVACWHMSTRRPCYSSQPGPSLSLSAVLGRSRTQIRSPQNVNRIIIYVREFVSLKRDSGSPLYIPPRGQARSLSDLADQPNGYQPSRSTDLHGSRSVYLILLPVSRTRLRGVVFAITKYPLFFLRIPCGKMCFDGCCV